MYLKAETLNCAAVVAVMVMVMVVEYVIFYLQRTNAKYFCIQLVLNAGKTVATHFIYYHRIKTKYFWEICNCLLMWMHIVTFVALANAFHILSILCASRRNRWVCVCVCVSVRENRSILWKWAKVEVAASTFINIIICATCNQLNVLQMHIMWKRFTKL